MQCVNAMNSSESEASEHSEAEKPAKKKRKESSEESDYKPAKPKKKKKNASDGSDSEGWQETKKKSNKKPGKYTGFTRPYKLSPELSSLMGKDEMPRHEVVKRVWGIIKERDLYDPRWVFQCTEPRVDPNELIISSNKQYAICDKELEKVIGVKRWDILM